MEVNFTARRYEAAPELRDYIEKKLEKLIQYQDGIREAKVTLTAEGYRHIAEVTLLARGHEFMGREESADMYSSIDLVVEKLAKQIRRKKEKRIARGRRNGRGGAQAEPPMGREAPFISLRETVEPPRTLTIEEALNILDEEDGEVMVFVNAENKRTTVIYLRDDGSYGLIEPTG